MRLTVARWFFLPVVGSVNAAGDESVLDCKLLWGRASPSVCRVVTEGGDPGETVEALREQDRG